MEKWQAFWIELLVRKPENVRSVCLKYGRYINLDDFIIVFPPMCLISVHPFFLFKKIVIFLKVLTFMLDFLFGCFGMVWVFCFVLPYFKKYYKHKGNTKFLFWLFIFGELSSMSLHERISCILLQKLQVQILTFPASLSLGMGKCPKFSQTDVNSPDSEAWLLSQSGKYSFWW